MLDNIKKIWTANIVTPLSKTWQAVAQRISPWLEPLARPLQIYKWRFDTQWAAFSFKNPRMATWIRRGTKLMTGLYVLYVIFAVGIFGEIPTVEVLKDMQTLNTSEVLTADSVLIGKFYKENRKDIRFEDIPQHVVDALVSTEDKRYFTHTGVDIRALGRVFFYSFLKGDEKSGGGSTLSQQLAKNLFPRQQYWVLSTFISKIREMLIARRLERAYDKNNLLAFYLNTVPFGGNVFGIEMAAKRFFNKSAKELNVQQGAVLIGMLQQNTRFNPRRNPENSRKRRNEVLDNMVENGKLDVKTGDLLKKDSTKLDYQPVLNRDAMASYFKDYLRITVPRMIDSFKLKKDDGTLYDIYKDGLRIYSSIDSKMQLLAEEAVTERMYELQRQFDDHWDGQKWWGDDKWLNDAMHQSERWKRMAADGKKEATILNFFKTEKLPMTIFTWENGKPAEDERNMTALDSIKHYFKQLNTGFMVSDPKTGLIKAWVGGTDFSFFQYDHCRSKRQVGSTFKPIVYAKALQAGIRPCEYIPNQLTAYTGNGGTKPGYEVTDEEKENVWMPRNADGGYGGSYSLEGALTNSVNVISAYLIHKVGVKSVQNLAHMMGVTNDIQEDMSIALGTTDISLYDMMKVYGTFATRGKRPEPVSVLKIVTRDGKVLVDFSKTNDPSKWQQVLSTDHADMMTKMMKSVVEDGTAGRLKYKYNINNDIAGKTGTTQNHSDGWFMCFTPNLVCGAWVGGMTPAVRFRDISLGQGAHMALPICGLFLDKLYKTPKYSALKEEKFAPLAKWIKDSMSCDPHVYTEDELMEIELSKAETDTTNLQYSPSGNPPFRDEDPSPKPQNDKNELRPKPDLDFGIDPSQPRPSQPKPTPVLPPSKPDVKPTLPPKPTTITTPKPIKQ